MLTCSRSASCFSFPRSAWERSPRRSAPQDSRDAERPNRRSTARRWNENIITCHKGIKVMKNLSIMPSLLTLTLALIAGAKPSNSRDHVTVQGDAFALSPSEGKQKAKTETPFACVPEALSPAERKRHFDELGPMLRKLSTGIRELKDGYAIEVALPLRRRECFRN